MVVVSRNTAIPEVGLQVCTQPAARREGDPRLESACSYRVPGPGAAVNPPAAARSSRPTDAGSGRAGPNRAGAKTASRAGDTACGIARCPGLPARRSPPSWRALPQARSRRKIGKIRKVGRTIWVFSCEHLPAYAMKRLPFRLPPANACPWSITPLADQGASRRASGRRYSRCPY